MAGWIKATHEASHQESGPACELASLNPADSIIRRFGHILRQPQRECLPIDNGHRLLQSYILSLINKRCIISNVKRA
jgi:hypothetical protein